LKINPFCPEAFFDLYIRPKLNWKEISTCMKRFTSLVFLLSFCFSLNAQHLLLEVFSSDNFTAYSLPELSQKQNFWTFGGRIAGGFRHLQFGLEYEDQLSDPSFRVDSLRRTEAIQSNFIGGLVRLKISSLPAYRFGLVFKAGAGIYNTQKVSKTFSNPPDEQRVDYGNLLGFNAGIGLSSPLFQNLQWGLHYQFNYVHRPSLQAGQETLPKYNAIHHSIQASLSLNFVFGKALEHAKQIIRR